MRKFLQKCFLEKVYTKLFSGVVGDWQNHFTISQTNEFDEYYKMRMKHYPELKFDYAI